MLIPILILAMTGAALALIAVGARMPAKEVSIEERLAAFAERPRPLEELELERPFAERVLRPLFRTWTRRIARFTPKQNMERLRQALQEAGSPSNLGPVEFMGLRGGMAVVLGGAALLITIVTGSTLRPIHIGALGIPGIILFPAPLGLLGYTLPGIWLNQKIRRRKKEIQKSLPDAIDLLTISVEAGLGFDPALARVAEKWDNALSREFRRMLQEIRIGKPRRDAMREVAIRCGVDDLRVFVSSIVQADQLGVSITQVLRVQSEQMRIRRRQRAEEQAHKAPIKMLFPMVFLIFPAMYVIILGPAVPTIFGAFK
ncbi:MAG TPA: type II secretion system F family protein [Thermomicrobiales bacterium]|nr:type II secretion system F family protein [Thermomicrobiales bacterium]